MSDAPPNGNAPPPAPSENPWARMGLPPIFNPTAPGGFVLNKVVLADGSPRYVLALHTPFGVNGLGFDEQAFAEFIRQAQSLRSGLILPG